MQGAGSGVPLCYTQSAHFFPVLWNSLAIHDFIRKCKLGRYWKGKVMHIYVGFLSSKVILDGNDINLGPDGKCKQQRKI
uniref:Uncharacterized protein n=1 Tax=Rhizophora mucronata TaxID=61149 RepID=A0A2P2NX54_RHIMU